jgi:hypothetical protein
VQPTAEELPEVGGRGPRRLAQVYQRDLDLGEGTGEPGRPVSAHKAGVQVHLDALPPAEKAGHALHRPRSRGEHETRRRLGPLQQDAELGRVALGLRLAEPGGPDPGPLVGQEVGDPVKGVRDRVVEQAPR